MQAWNYMKTLRNPTLQLCNSMPTGTDIHTYVGDMRCIMGMLHTKSKDNMYVKKRFSIVPAWNWILDCHWFISTGSWVTKRYSDWSVSINRITFFFLVYSAAISHLAPFSASGGAAAWFSMYATKYKVQYAINKNNVERVSEWVLS